MSHRITPLALSALTAVTCLALVRCSSTTVTKAAPTTEQEAGTEEDAGTLDEDSSVAVTCPATQKATVLATVSAAAINEASGIGSSTKNPGIFWLHNDSGDVARTFAVDSTGALRATVSFDTVMPTDIEDMSIEDDGATSNLYFGDIGDNGEARASLTIHRVAEPKLGTGAPETLTIASEKMTVVYPDGAHNAETLLFDPIDKVLLIVTKKAGGPSAFHRIGAFAAGTKATTKKISEFSIDLATGGEISRDGKYIAIRNYSPTGYLWIRNDGETLEAALARPPCKIPIAAEAQGEAFDFLPGATGYVTTTEGASPPVTQTLFK
jgi:hypothetical protein